MMEGGLELFYSILSILGRGMLMGPADLLHMTVHCHTHIASPTEQLMATINIDLTPPASELDFGLNPINVNWISNSTGYDWLYKFINLSVTEFSAKYSIPHSRRARRFCTCLPPRASWPLWRPCWTEDVTPTSRTL